MKICRVLLVNLCVYFSLASVVAFQCGLNSTVVVHGCIDVLCLRNPTTFEFVCQ